MGEASTPRATSRVFATVKGASIGALAGMAGHVTGEVIGHVLFSGASRSSGETGGNVLAERIRRGMGPAAAVGAAAGSAIVLIQEALRQRDARGQHEIAR